MAKRLNPIDRYVKACAWCGKPFVQKDPEFPYCCKTHEIYARRGMPATIPFTLSDRSGDRNKVIMEDLIMFGRAFVPDDPSMPPVAPYSEEAQQILENMEEPENLSGLELLAWRNEQRAKQNPNG
jgi:hypothetical protein